MLVRKLWAAAIRAASVTALLAVGSSSASYAQSSTDVQSILNAISGQPGLSSQAPPPSQIRPAPAMPTQTPLSPAIPTGVSAGSPTAPATNTAVGLEQSH